MKAKLFEFISNIRKFVDSIKIGSSFPGSPPGRIENVRDLTHGVGSKNVFAGTNINTF